MKNDLIKLLTIKDSPPQEIKEYITKLAANYIAFSNSLRESIFSENNDYHHAKENLNDLKVLEIILLSFVLVSINYNNLYNKNDTVEKVRNICASLKIEYEDVLFALRHEQKIRGILNFND